MTKDIADRSKEGTLPSSPADESTRVRTLQAVKPGGRDPAMDAERALLGSILWAGLYEPPADRAKTVASIVEPEMFRTRAHGETFAALLAVEGAKGATEPVLVASEARRSGSRVESEYLANLATEASAPAATKLLGWANVIREDWMRRQAAEFGRQTAAMVAAGQMSSAEVIADARARLDTLGAKAVGTSGTITLKDALKGFALNLSKQAKAYRTGFRDLDEAIVGLFPRETSIVAARTSIGKSLLAAAIAKNIVDIHPDAGCLYVSLEMDAQPFSARLAAADAGVPARKLRRGNLDPEEWSRFMSSAERLARLPISFVTSTTQTLVSVEAEARQLSAALSLKGSALALIVIDYVGLIKPSAELVKRANREQQVAETSRGLRYLAQRFNCHVMALAQIGRESEKDKGGGMPKLHQLRESDSLANDADLTLILHRERDAHTGLIRTDKPAALAVAKARHDETSVMLLSFEPQFVRFGDHNETTRYGDVYGR